MSYSLENKLSRTDVIVLSSHYIST